MIYTCQCGYDTRQKRQFTRHVAQHKRQERINAEPLRCTACKAKFESEKARQEHVRRFHIPPPW